ncbi:MAG: hypothetical protein IPM38_14965 [Ignavibacteria bacterium]|nr:hypothetical protein [Ignavibacteria bacterium]
MNNFYEDNEGNIWVSTYGDGVYCLNNLFLRNYCQKDGLSNKKFFQLKKTNLTACLSGTLDRLNVLDNNTLI